MFEITTLHRCAPALLVALGTAGYFTTASADENPSGPYVGAGAGQFYTKLENFESFPEAVERFESSDDFAWKVFFGWRFLPWLAVEADYIDLGNPSADFQATGSDGRYRVELSGFAPYVIGTLPIGIFELSGKVGYYWHDLKINANFNNIGEEGEVFHTSENAEAWVYGAGAGVTFFEHLNTKVEYELYDVERMKDTYALWLTGEWRF